MGVEYVKVLRKHMSGQTRTPKRSMKASEHGTVTEQSLVVGDDAAVDSASSGENW